MSIGGGAYAEIARVDHRVAIPIPKHLDMVDAAAIPKVFVTAHEALVHLAGLQHVEIVLIHGAAGGLSAAAVQSAHAIGVTVIATTTAEKLEQVRSLGADVAVDDRAHDFAEAVTATTGGNEVDVVIDFIGAPYLERNVRSLTTGGRRVQVGIMGGGANAKLPLENSDAAPTLHPSERHPEPTCLVIPTEQDHHTAKPFVDGPG